MLFALAAFGTAAECSGSDATVTSAALDWPARGDEVATVERAPEGSAVTATRGIAWIGDTPRPAVGRLAVAGAPTGGGEPLLVSIEIVEIAR